MKWLVMVIWFFVAVFVHVMLQNVLQLHGLVISVIFFVVFFLGISVIKSAFPDKPAVAPGDPR